MELPTQGRYDRHIFLCVEEVKPKCAPPEETTASTAPSAGPSEDSGAAPEETESPVEPEEVTCESIIPEVTVADYRACVNQGTCSASGITAAAISREQGASATQSPSHET